MCCRIKTGHHPFFLFLFGDGRERVTSPCSELNINMKALRHGYTSGSVEHSTRLGAPTSVTNLCNPGVRSERIFIPALLGLGAALEVVS